MSDLTQAEQAALQRLSEVEPDRLDSLVEEFGNQNDRAAAIVGAAQLDDLLVGLLERFLLPDRKPSRKGDNDSLLGHDRGLGTFSARITAAHRFGLIGTEFARSLDVIRDIRNAFAHRVEPPDLNQSPHQERIAQLYRPIPSQTFWDVYIAKFGNNTPANQFRAIIAVYALLLMGDAKNVARISRQPLLTGNLSDPGSGTPHHAARQNHK